MKKGRERRHIVLSQIPKEISNKIAYFDWSVETVTTQGHTVEQRFKYLEVACAILLHISDNSHSVKQHKKKQPIL